MVILQQTAERGLKSSGSVESHMVNILVQGLDGKHLSMKIAGSTRVSALCGDLSKVTGIPMDAFDLTRQSKVLQCDEELWLEKDERLCMRGRGGMDGDWTCQHCGRQGCWLTKVRCYRCGKSKFDPPSQQSMDGNLNVPWTQATSCVGVGSGTGGQSLGQKPPPRLEPLTVQQL